jgi:hypothetical protein
MQWSLLPEVPLEVKLLLQHQVDLLFAIFFALPKISKEMTLLKQKSSTQ